MDPLAGMSAELAQVSCDAQALGAFCVFLRLKKKATFLEE